MVTVPGAESKHELMVSILSFNHRNLMNFDEAEVNYNDAPVEGFTVLLKSQSPHTYNEINRTKIHVAVERHTGVVLPIDNIYRYLYGYVVVTNGNQLIPDNQ
jgi:hypothetical protein